MKNKDIVKKYWRDFELLAFRILSDELNGDSTLWKAIDKTITEPSKDGGYDGEFIICHMDNVSEKILFEAKLRSNDRKDLPLSDFAKSIIIAIIRNTDCIHIITNVHFSKETINRLALFSENTDLTIKLKNGYSIKQYIISKENRVTDFDSIFLGFLKGCKSDREQNLPNSSAVVSQEPPALSTVELNHYRLMLRQLIRKTVIMLVEGKEKTGKSFYINRLYSLARFEKKHIFIFDFAKQITYQDFILELLNNILGISLELVQLMNSEQFNEAFKQIGLSTVDEDEMDVLRAVFYQDNLKIDYSFVFTKFVKIFFQIISLKKYSNPIIIFSNLSYANPETLQLIKYLIKENSFFSFVLEMREDRFLEQNNNAWSEFIRYVKQQPNLAAKNKYTQPWTKAQAKQFLRKKIPDLTENQYENVIAQFGYQPYELDPLAEIYELSEINKITPRELIYDDIKRIDNSKPYELYRKYFEYITAYNSDLIYVLLLLFFLKGECTFDVISLFFCESRERVENCRNIISDCRILSVGFRKIQVTSHQVTQALENFCTKNVSITATNCVIDFITRNIDSLYLTYDEKLELNCKLNYFISEIDYFISLLKLGKMYLSSSQWTSAQSTFEKAYDLPCNNVSDAMRLDLYISYIESVIWQYKSFIILVNELLYKSNLIIMNHTADEKDFSELLLRYCLINYQINHNQQNNVMAYEFAVQGVKLVKKNKLYHSCKQYCGKIYRFYAVSIKEKTNNIHKCISAFRKGLRECPDSSQVIFGYIVHKNMNIHLKNYRRRLHRKLCNYAKLKKYEPELSIDEVLHYRVNVAAINFLLKNYQSAKKDYLELLEKSRVFSIYREQIRILNDLANIDVINEDIQEALKKYYKSIRLSEETGYSHNYWPALLNATTIEVRNRNYPKALENHEKLKPYFTNICKAVDKKTIGIEIADYNHAAIIIHLNNLFTIHNYFSNQFDNRILDFINTVLADCKIFCITRQCNVKEVSDILHRHTLSGSMYEHTTQNSKLIWLLKS